ncbi:hypothetical protein ScalyP_jg4671 [Parmales sp. scaly parma]|nr:hypothetical protein ScalyP_jg4671 [Parmales sp. scaly parma]
MWGERTPLEQKGQGAAEIHLPGVHEHGGCEENPEVDLKFPGGTLTLSTWREIKQLDFVRHCLQSGFLGEMSNNETLQDIFGAVYGNIDGHGKQQDGEGRQEAADEQEFRAEQNQ